MEARCTIELDAKQAELLGKEEGDCVEVTIEYVYEDHGIGPYEYWGVQAVHHDYAIDIESIHVGKLELPTNKEQYCAILRNLRALVQIKPEPDF